MIHIDGIIFSLQRHGGISVYFRELLTRLRSHQIHHTLTLESPLQQEIGQLSDDAIIRNARRLERYRSCRMLNSKLPHVFHSSYYRLPARRGQASVVTVHDFAYERTVKGPRTWLHRWQKNSAIQHAQSIICVSESTRLDLLELATIRNNQKIYVVHNGVSDEFYPVDISNKFSTTEPPFILFVGQRGRYKNFSLALQVLELLPEFQLYCVGGGALQPSELYGVPISTHSRIRHLGFVTDSQLNILYNRAFCLLYPSSYEGFGIPVIEAMRAGCPVVSIACRALLEVGADALTVATTEPDVLAKAIKRLYEPTYRNDKRIRGIEISHRFSWNKTFEETMSIYRTLA